MDYLKKKKMKKKKHPPPSQFINLAYCLPEVRHHSLSARVCLRVEIIFAGYYDPGLHDQAFPRWGSSSSSGHAVVIARGALRHQEEAFLSLSGPCKYLKFLVG